MDRINSVFSQDPSAVKCPATLLLGNGFSSPPSGTCSSEPGTIILFPIDFIPSHLKNIILGHFLSFPGARAALPCSSAPPKSASTLPIHPANTSLDQQGLPANKTKSARHALLCSGISFLPSGMVSRDLPNSGCSPCLFHSPYKLLEPPSHVFFLDPGPSPGIGNQCLGCTKGAEIQLTNLESLVNTCNVSTQTKEQKIKIVLSNWEIVFSIILTAATSPTCSFLQVYLFLSSRWLLLPGCSVSHTNPHMGTLLFLSAS